MTTARRPRFSSAACRSCRSTTPSAPNGTSSLRACATGWWATLPTRHGSRASKQPVDSVRIHTAFGFQHPALHVPRRSLYGPSGCTGASSLPRLNGMSYRACRPCFAALSLIATTACGAKTGLLVPDIGPDVSDAMDVADSPDIIDVPPIFESCVPGLFDFRRQTADVLFVIDRSGSMAWNLAGQTVPPSRWSLLQNALNATLPSVQSTVSMGAVFFPQVPSDASDVTQQCQTLLSPDVALGLNHANDILQMFNTTMPVGGTPTFDALGVAQQVLESTAGRGDARFIVLATDGAPNCNGGLDQNTCVCTSWDMMGNPNCPTSTDGSYLCLDDTRTVAEITPIAASGIPVYIIGIADSTDPQFVGVLNQMAVAGGRPNPAGPEQYYSVRNPGDLVAAFTTIQNAIARCVFVTPSRPDDLVADPSAARRHRAAPRHHSHERLGLDGHGLWGGHLVWRRVHCGGQQPFLVLTAQALGATTAADLRRHAARLDVAVPRFVRDDGRDRERNALVSACTRTRCARPARSNVASPSSQREARFLWKKLTGRGVPRCTRDDFRV